SPAGPKGPEKTHARGSMNIESIRKRRVPVGLGFLLVAVWLLTGIRRTDQESGPAVLDSPLGALRPRVLAAGWHLAPRGPLPISRYPLEPVTLSFEAGGRDRTTLVTHEGIEVTATATIRYRLEPDRVLEVHRSVGPGYTRVLERWVQDALRTAIGSSDY